MRSFPPGPLQSAIPDPMGLKNLRWHSVFSIINSAGILLQKDEISLFVAQDAMENAYTKFKDLEKAEVQDKFIEKAKEKWKKMGLENPDFSIIRQRIIKKMLGESASDTQMSLKDKHRVFYFYMLDYQKIQFHHRHETRTY